MSTRESLDEALEALMRFDSVADDLVRDLRWRRRRGDAGAADDLDRIRYVLAEFVKPGAEVLTQIAERWDQQRGKIAG